MMLNIYAPLPCKPVSIQTRGNSAPLKNSHTAGNSDTGMANYHFATYSVCKRNSNHGDAVRGSKEYDGNGLSNCAILIKIILR
jgi:hypothetical protein